MLVICKAWAYFGTWHFGKRHFGMDISSSWTFWQVDFLAPRTIRQMDISSLWMFWPGDFLACGLFGTSTFGMETLPHWDILAWIFQRSGCFGTHFGICITLYGAKIYMSICWNIPVTKCTSPVTSQAGTSMVLKNSCAETSLCQNCPYYRMNFGDRLFFDNKK